MATSSSSTPVELTKRPHTKTKYTDEQLLELLDCADNPLYFMRNFMRVQHPTKGAIPFDPFPFQEEMVESFETNRFSIVMTARQMGKCVTPSNQILKDGSLCNIDDLLSLSLREKIIRWLELQLLRLGAMKRLSPSDGT